MSKIVLMLAVISLLTGLATAQEAGVAVPDLTGLSVPAAAALLNSSGLVLGSENNEGWTSDSGLEQNRIRGQSIAVGASAPTGTTVDVTVLRSPNALLIYDDNDLSLVNQTGAELNLTGIALNTLDGAAASLAGTRWAGSLRAGQCVQVWSVGRNGPKGLDECGTIQNWLVTTNPGEHFWTGEGGTTHFNLTQNGVQRADCPVANPGRCAFYLSGGTGGDSTAYIYFAYTSDRLAVINQSSDQWMALNGFNLFNYNTPVATPGAGAPIPLGDRSLYQIRNPAARVGQLAPGQCLLFTKGADVPLQAPQPCQVIASLGIDPSLIFWSLAFEMDSSDGERRSCPAAIDGRITVCVMPR